MFATGGPLVRGMTCSAKMTLALLDFISLKLYVTKVWGMVYDLLSQNDSGSAGLHITEIVCDKSPGHENPTQHKCGL